MNQLVNGCIIPCCQEPEQVMVLFCLACLPDDVTPGLTVGGGFVIKDNESE